MFRKYDAGNLLLTQARERGAEPGAGHPPPRARCWSACGAQRVDFVELTVPSPFALPLMVERFREKLTTEKLKDRLDRMLKDMERAAVREEERDAG